MLMSIPQWITLEIPGTQSMTACDFDWVFLEISVKNCIMRMFLTCPIVELQGAVGAVAVTIKSKAGRFVGEQVAMRL